MRNCLTSHRIHDNVCIMNKQMTIMESCKQIYRKYGYTTEKDFPNEYFFMFNPLTLERVRLYYNGRVLEYR